MTDKDRTEATKALMRWFNSQEIMPADAAIVMIELLAACLVNKTKSIVSLQESCEDFKLGLILNVALLLKPEAR